MKRQRDLDDGVDGDLVRASNKRWIFAVCMVVGAGGLLYVARSLVMPNWLRNSLSVVAVFVLFIGAVLERFAAAQRRYLDKPDAEPPLSLFKR
jgi:hypothetical protein